MSTKMITAACSYLDVLKPQTLPKYLASYECKTLENLCRGNFCLPKNYLDTFL